MNRQEILRLYKLKNGKCLGVRAIYALSTNRPIGKKSLYQIEKFCKRNGLEFETPERGSCENWRSQLTR